MFGRILKQFFFQIIITAAAVINLFAQSPMNGYWEEVPGPDGTIDFMTVSGK